MWNREGIKNYAKDFLRKHYWKAFLACLIVTLLSGGGGDSGGNSDNDYNDDNHYYNEYEMMDEYDDDVIFKESNRIIDFMTWRIKSPLLLISGGAISVMIALSIILLITVGYAVEVGLSRFFLRGFKGDISIGKIFSTFNSEEYFAIVRTQFLRSLYNFLWSLLFIIPGIIKSYEYRFVHYILAENPDLSANEVITLSRDITDGHKWDMFILDLSFIGWYLLGGLLFGVGIFFVDPYREASYAKLYNILAGNDDLENNVDDDYNVIIE